MLVAPAGLRSAPVVKFDGGSGPCTGHIDVHMMFCHFSFNFIVDLMQISYGNLLVDANTFPMPIPFMSIAYHIAYPMLKKRCLSYCIPFVTKRINL
jgi:hypothetical protein